MRSEKEVPSEFESMFWLWRVGKVADIAAHIPLDGLPVYDNISGPAEPAESEER